MPDDYSIPRVQTLALPPEYGNRCTIIALPAAGFIRLLSLRVTRVARLRLAALQIGAQFGRKPGFTLSTRIILVPVVFYLEPPFSQELG
jgi:hypothetical protein